MQAVAQVMAVTAAVTPETVTCVVAEKSNEPAAKRAALNVEVPPAPPEGACTVTFIVAIVLPATRPADQVIVGVALHAGAGF